MTILEMLSRLAEIAPDVCQKRLKIYKIGAYEFYNHRHYGFLANLTINPGSSVASRPALAWLADAIMGECEKRGWGWRLEIWEISGKYAALIWGLDYVSNLIFADTQAEALLAAFLAAVEGER